MGAGQSGEGGGRRGKKGKHKRSNSSGGTVHRSVTVGGSMRATTTAGEALGAGGSGRGGTGAAAAASSGVATAATPRAVTAVAATMSSPEAATVGSAGRAAVPSPTPGMGFQQAGTTSAAMGVPTGAAGATAVESGAGSVRGLRAFSRQGSSNSSRGSSVTSEELHQRGPMGRGSAGPGSTLGDGTIDHRRASSEGETQKFAGFGSHIEDRRRTTSEGAARKLQGFGSTSRGDDRRQSDDSDRSQGGMSPLSSGGKTPPPQGARRSQKAPSSEKVVWSVQLKPVKGRDGSNSGGTTPGTTETSEQVSSPAEWAGFASTPQGEDPSSGKGRSWQGNPLTPGGKVLGGGDAMGLAPGQFAAKARHHQHASGGGGADSIFSWVKEGGAQMPAGMNSGGAAHVPAMPAGAAMGIGGGTFFQPNLMAPGGANMLVPGGAGLIAPTGLNVPGLGAFGLPNDVNPTLPAIPNMPLPDAASAFAPGATNMMLPAGQWMVPPANAMMLGGNLMAPVGNLMMPAGSVMAPGVPGLGLLPPGSLAAGTSGTPLPLSPFPLPPAESSIASSFSSLLLPKSRSIQEAAEEEEEEEEVQEDEEADPPLVDADLGPVMSLEEGEKPAEERGASRGSDGAPQWERTEEGREGDAPFCSGFLSTAKNSKFGRSRPVSCGVLPADTPAIRPSRLGICPGSAVEQSSDIIMVPWGGTGAAGSAEARGVGFRQEEEEEEEVDQRAIIAAVNEAQGSFMEDATVTGMTTCDKLLTALLDVTESTFGFIASNFSLADGTPCLKTNAVTNVMWTDRLRLWYTDHVKSGLVFTHVEADGLFGSAALRGQAVIGSAPQQDKLPKGHPRVNGVLSVPIICGPCILGVAVVANRIGGYSVALLRPLQPLLTSIANILFAVAWRLDTKESIRNYLTPVTEEGMLSVDETGTVVSLDSSALSILGFSPVCLRRKAQLGLPRRLSLLDLFQGPTGTPESLLAWFLESRRRVVARQQGGQRILVNLEMIKGQDSPVDAASVYTARLKVAFENP